MKVKPASGLSVRHPDSLRLLAADGEEVSDTDTYWLRRLRDGDVERVEAPPSNQSQS